MSNLGKHILTAFHHRTLALVSALVLFTLALAAPVSAVAASTASATSIASATATSANPAVEVCGQGTPVVQPTSVILTCADNGEVAANLKWTSWTGTRATATGDVTWRSCAERCANSRQWASATADITLSDPVREPGAGVLFTRLTMHATGATPKGFMRDLSYSEAPTASGTSAPAPQPSTSGTRPTPAASEAPSGTLGYAQIQGFWIIAGGPTTTVNGYTDDQIAAAITGAESSFEPGIIQAGVDYCGPGADRAGWGLWQITCGNSVPAYCTDFHILDPWNNAEAAVEKFKGAGGFTPWSTYTSGAYLSHLQHTTADQSVTDPGEYVQVNATPSGTPATSVPQPGSTCGPAMPGGTTSSTIVYTGPTTAGYNDTFTATATVTSGGAVSGGSVKFILGAASCTATTDASGTAGCQLTPVDAPGPNTLTATFAGDGTHPGSTTSVAFTITRVATTLAYTGPTHVANGVPETLSGVLEDANSSAVAGRSVLMALGTGTSQQTCTGVTDATGTASCTIPLVNQPLTDTATVPISLTFSGDAYYLPSSASATAQLEYYTGRSFGLSADVNLLLAQLNLPATPDTGQVQTAQASSTTTPCTVNIDTVLIDADALCANVTTTLAPGTSTTTATVQDATIGLPGLPVIGISGLTATSVSSCTGTSGSATLNLTIGGNAVAVSTAPNTVIGLPDGARLVINEQSAVPGADFGTTVNAVHLIIPPLLDNGNTADVIIGSATSAAHNCG